VIVILLACCQWGSRKKGRQGKRKKKTLILSYLVVSNETFHEGISKNSIYGNSVNYLIKISSVTYQNLRKRTGIYASSTACIGFMITEKQYIKCTKQAITKKIPKILLTNNHRVNHSLFHSEKFIRFPISSSLSKNVKEI
jgi:hypothetical protein